MPFKLKLKKSRQYNVTSKSLFVISVHHLLVLDTPTTVDCTLSCDSTGQECLDNVCQRLSINQLEFFGLRYVVKDTDELRWVDLERPLSRQLEKHAASPRLYLRVMYYVISGVSLINDEVTRNYYFLQLKSDVVDGRILCDPKQAVILAIYCRQAQYDSHQSERHTVDYLKTLLPFPRHMIEAGLLETLTEEVLQPNADVQKLTQAAAEGLFIAACQQLDGYGQEKFVAKDDTSAEVVLGITVSGVAVTGTGIEYSKFYPWHDISNVVNHKRTFNIECTMPENSVGFTLSDADTGRYFWKLCVLQHTFYMRFEQNQKHTPEGNLNLFANVPEEPYDSRDNLFHSDQANLNLYASDSHISTGGATIASWKNDSTVSSNVSLAASQQQLRAINQNWSAVNQHNSNWGLTAGVGNGSNASLNNRAQSSSCLDLSNNNVSQDRERLKALLPGYRPAPDYETAVHQKYCISETELHQQKPHSQVNVNAVLSDPYLNIYSGSQPDVHRATSAADAIFGKQLQQQYPDVTQTTNPLFQQGLNGELDGFTQQLHRFNKPPPPYAANRLSSTSTPDLALASHRALHGYLGAYVSGSSPDLVSTRTFLNSQYIQQTSALGGGQSHLAQQHQIPSMLPSGAVPNGTNTFRYRYSQSHVPHGTYENLNFVEPPQQTTSNAVNSLHPPQPMQRTYDTNQQLPTAAYRKSSSQQHLPQQYAQANSLIKSQQHLARNGSIEPIYENVPLPRTGDATANEMRDRTSSIQSAPGVMRFNQQRPLNAGSLNILNDPNLNVSGLNIQHDETDAATVGTRNNTPEILVHRSVSKTSSNPIHLTQNVHHPQPPHPHPPHPQPHHDNHHHVPTTTYAIPQPPHSMRFPSVTPSESKSQSSLNYALNTTDPTTMAAANRSHSTNQLNASQSSAYTNITSTTTDSGVSSSFSGGLRNASLNSTALTDADSSKAKEKKKRRWGFFGGSKTSLTDKQKSATLGRTKDKGSKSALALEEESNLRHRWSTGLPRGPAGPVPLPVTMSKEKLCQILETKLCDPQLYVEFECIPKRKDNACYDSALLDENRARNIDPHFLPYDDNRVHLTPSRENRLGYVNASHVSATVGAKQRFYVVAQSPTVATLTTFLQCVWEADVYLLVQLSDEVNYVPTSSSKCLEYGQYQVWQEFSQVTDRCITSKLRLYHTSSRRYRSVWHLNYSEWAEQNCPKDVGHFLDFLEELNSVRLAAVNEVPPGHNSNPPVMIHCSEGGGRGGIALAADLLLYTLDHNQDLDIPRVVSQLRQQRDNIIPSLAQYKFMYALLIHYLKQTRLI